MRYFVAAVKSFYSSSLKSEVFSKLDEIFLDTLQSIPVGD